MKLLNTMIFGIGLITIIIIVLGAICYFICRWGAKKFYPNDTGKDNKQD